MTFRVSGKKSLEAGRGDPPDAKVCALNHSVPLKTFGQREYLPIQLPNY